MSEALYRLRHGPGRIGKSAAAVLEAVVECPGVSRGELAAKLGVKPDSLSRPLKKLVDRELIERCGKGTLPTNGRLAAEAGQGKDAYRGKVGGAPRRTAVRAGARGLSALPGGEGGQ